MLDGRGGDDVRALFARLPRGGAGAARLQVLLFSATLDSPGVRSAAAAMCANPLHVDLRGGALPEGVDHFVVLADPKADRSWMQGEPRVVTDGVHAHDAAPGGGDLLGPGADCADTWSEAVKRLKPRLVRRLVDALQARGEGVGGWVGTGWVDGWAGAGWVGG